jgi:hypothetical protein
MKIMWVFLRKKLSLLMHCFPCYYLQGNMHLNLRKPWVGKVEFKKLKLCPERFTEPILVYHRPLRETAGLSLV